MYWNIWNKYSQFLFLHTLIASMVSWLLLQEFVCIDDYDQNIVRCRPKCNYGKFSLFGMTACYSWLSCAEIDQIRITVKIGHGAVKKVQFYGFCSLMLLL